MANEHPANEFLNGAKPVQKRYGDRASLIMSFAKYMYYELGPSPLFGGLDMKYQSATAATPCAAYRL